MAYLICDSREKEGPINFITLSSTKIETLQLGDYCVMLEEKLLYLFERKTWKDLASSITDGRYVDQKKRLTELNNKGEVKCFYIIEGPISYEKDKLIQKIPFSTLENAKISIIMSNLGLIQTKNSEETMKFLENFLSYFNRKKNKNVIGGSKLDLKAPIKTNEDYKTSFYLNIKSIGENLLPNLMKYKIKEIFSVCSDYKNAYMIFCEFKYVQSGKKITEKTIEKLIKIFSNPSKEEQIKMLSSFPRFTKKSAEKILEKLSFKEIIFMKKEDLAEIYKSDKKKIGLSDSEKLINIIDL